VPEALSGRSIELADPQAVLLDCITESAGYRPVFLDCNRRVALCSKALQKTLAVIPWPPSIISPFVSRIRYECHLPFLSFFGRRAGLLA
jgi:hypothetical protein